MSNNLELCRKIAKQIKDGFPDQILKIEKNTIIEHSVKNKRLMKYGHRDNMSGCYAYYVNVKPHRIVVKQKILKNGIIYSTYGGRHSLSIVPPYKKYVDLYRYTLHGGKIFGRARLEGNWAFIDLMCHELAHHRTKGHAKGFKVKYHRLLDYMANRVISGEFYREL